jgi:hypothetical protein
MSITYYDTASLYIESASANWAKVQRIDQIIEALEAQMLIDAGKENIAEYSLDDGQVKIRTVYRGIESVTAAIKALETRRQKLLNKLNGRISVLRPHQGLRK